jgi:hypothetical protein
MGEWLRREMPVVFEWWFWVVLALVCLVEIGAALGVIPNGGRLCPWWAIGC